MEAEAGMEVIEASTGLCATCGNTIEKDGTCRHLREVFAAAEGRVAADRLPPRGGKRSELVATLVPGVEGSIEEPEICS